MPAPCFSETPRGQQIVCPRPSARKYTVQPTAGHNLLYFSCVAISTIHLNACTITSLWSIHASHTFAIQTQGRLLGYHSIGHVSSNNFALVGLLAGMSCVWSLRFPLVVQLLESYFLTWSCVTWRQYAICNMQCLTLSFTSPLLVALLVTEYKLMQIKFLGLQAVLEV